MKPIIYEHVNITSELRHQ